MRPPRDPAPTEAAFARFVEASQWRFERTYVTSYPHEYTLAQWCGAEAFGEAIPCIEAEGVRIGSSDAASPKLLRVDTISVMFIVREP